MVLFPTRRLGDALLHLQILLVIISTAGVELRGEPNHVMVGFERANLSDSEIGKSQQKADADSAQHHYQAGLVALEKNDLAAAEEEMQTAARLAPKNAMIFYKLAVIQSKRDEWQPALKNIDAARKLGLPKNLEDEAVQLAADVITKQLQANTAENNKKFAWFDQMEWLQGKYIFTKMLNHDSECVKDYHWIDNILDMKPEYDKSEFSGTLTLRERHTVSETGAAGCADASAASGSSSGSLSRSLSRSLSGSSSGPGGESNGDSAAAGSKAETKAASSKEPNKESYRDAVLRVVVKRDDGINDGKIRMFATLESCKGNACDTLERETTVYIVEKSESGSPQISISVLSDGDKDGRIEEQFRKQRGNRS
jgi:tetratricopeptide (TPR) repeat protein